MQLELKELESHEPLFPVELEDCKMLKAQTIIALYDTATNINLVREDWARDAGLDGVPVTKTIEMASGGSKQWQSKIYSIPLVKRSGEVIRIIAMGVEKITGDLEHADHSQIAWLFLSITSWRLIRPSRSINLLVSIGHAELHPYLNNPELHHQGNL